MPRLGDKDITKRINDWNSSKYKKDMLKSKQYYLTDNDIKQREFQLWTATGRQKDIYRNNSRWLLIF